MGIPSAIVDNEFFGGSPAQPNPQGPNVEPAGSNLGAGPNATTGPPGVIRNLNAMWLHPGMLDITGTGFSTPPAIQKLYAPQFPGIAFPGGRWSFPGWEMPEMTGGGGAGDMGGGSPSGGGKGIGGLPSGAPNILQLVGLAGNLLKGFGGPGGGPGGSESSGPGGAPGAQGQTGLEADYSEFKPGLLEQLQGGQISPYDLIDPEGNLMWDKLGIDWRTDPKEISDFFATRGVDINTPGWMKAEFGLEGPHVEPGQYNLGLDTKLNTDIKEPTQYGGPGFSDIANLLSNFVNMAPGVPDEVKQGIQAAKAAYQLGSGISDVAAGSAGGYGSIFGALGTGASMANQAFGGPKELSYALQDLGLLAGSFGPQFVYTVPMLLGNIAKQVGLVSQHGYPKFPKGFVPFGGGYSAVNPYTGMVLNSPDRNPVFEMSPESQAGQRATARNFYDWNIPSPLYRETMPSVDYLLQGFGGQVAQPHYGGGDSAGDYSGIIPQGYGTFNQGYEGKTFQSNPTAWMTGGPAVENPYREALNRIYQHYLGRDVDPTGYRGFTPILAQQGPQEVVNDIVNSEEFRNYIQQNPTAVPEFAPPPPPDPAYPTGGDR